MINIKLVILVITLFFLVFLIIKTHTGSFSKVVEEDFIRENSKWRIIGKLEIEKGRIVRLVFQNFTSGS
jgi:hypothetical protein